MYTSYMEELIGITTYRENTTMNDTLEKRTFIHKYEVTPTQAREFQKLLRSAREKRGLAQAEAAKEAGVSQALISSLERGPYDGMRFLDFMKVIRYYNITPNEVAALLGLLPNDPDVPDEYVGELTRVRRKLLDLPQEVRREAIKMMDIILDGYLRG